MQNEIIKTIILEFKSRLGPLEAIRGLKAVGTGYDLNQPNRLLFPITRAEILRTLIDYEYPELIHQILKNIEIHDGCRDTFSSEMDDGYIALVNEILKEQRQAITISNVEAGFSIEAPNFLLDFSLPAISQIHSEFELTTNHLYDSLQAVGGNKEQLFLNSKGASRASNAIMCWLAGRMEIPLSSGIEQKQLIGVV